MDFDVLKAELENKKRSLASAGPNTRKYIRRGDEEKKREEEYLKEQEEIERTRQAKLQQRLEKIEENKESYKPSRKPTTNNDEQAYFLIPAEEVTRRLRKKGQPVRFFGETEKQRTLRLKNLEALEEIEGQQNDFMRKMLELDSTLDMDALRKTAQGQGEEVDELKKKAVDEQQTLLQISSQETEPISSNLLKTDPEKTRSLISLYFRRLLREWEEQMNERPDDIKRSTQGKIAAATQKQAQDYLKPLFQRLKSNTVPDDVLANVTEICCSMQHREYVKANDFYLRLAIGNAPWPIGVTMVGIHERSAREKIFSNQVAHVLNDETQRKWIQSMKRLMTFCQNRYPPKDLAHAIG